LAKINLAKINLAKINLANKKLAFFVQNNAYSVSEILALYIHVPGSWI
jgi:hypothetical protein